MVQILMVEDDESLGATLQERLQKEGYQVTWAKTLRAATDLCRQAEKKSAFDLVLLDIGLPDGSGLSLARELESSNISIVFLSALNSAEFRLEGFELGAADYIPKPFHLKELLLRVKRVLEKNGAFGRIDCGEFAMELESQSLIFRDGRREYPGLRDFELLKLLVTQTPRAFSREDIISSLWQADSQQTGRSVDNAILRLRQILRPANCDHIAAVRGVGYRWQK